MLLIAITFLLTIEMQAWTLQHLVEPRYFREGEEAEGSVLSQVEAFLEPPKLMALDSKKCIIFSVFYTAAVTFPFLVTVMYWLVLFHPDPSAYPVHLLDAALQSSTAPTNTVVLRYFVLVNVYGFNAMIALFEIMLLSSARKQKVCPVICNVRYYTPLLTLTATCSTRRRHTRCHYRLSDLGCNGQAGHWPIHLCFS